MPVDGINGGNEPERNTTTYEIHVLLFITDDTE